MKCIFCKQNSDNSKSVEHIIPESLGNKEHVLKRGIVCDSCNQYFANKIENPLLSTAYFKHIRHRNNIENKKRKIPKIYGIMGGQVELGRDSQGHNFIDVPNESTMTGILSGKIQHLIVPIIESPIPNDLAMSRFLAKMAIEILSLRLYPYEGWNEEIVNKQELDLLRDFARYGSGPTFWEYSQRRIYNESDRFFDQEYSDFPYEVLHEIDIKYLREGELFLIVVIMGIEYVINYTNPQIADYNEWLMENNQVSPININEKRRLIRTDEDY